MGFVRRLLTHFEYRDFSKDFVLGFETKIGAKAINNKPYLALLQRTCPCVIQKDRIRVTVVQDIHARVFDRTKLLLIIYADCNGLYHNGSSSLRSK